MLMYRDKKGNLIEKRAKRDLITALISIPIILIISILMGTEKTNTPNKEINQVDTGHVAPSVSDTLTFARPHARK